MKKLVLLFFVILTTTFIRAAEPTSSSLHKPIANRKVNTSMYSRNNKPRSLRSNPLQTVQIGKAGNMLTVLNANCHQLDADSALNSVLFIHRSDTVYGTSYNVAQYRYDISNDGGNTWNVNIGPLNPLADNITINGRYPEAVLLPDSAYPTNPDSAWIVYQGSWHNGGTTDRWQGQFFGVGRLDGDTTSYTQHDQIVNNQNVEISTSMIKTANGDYWNLNLNYTALSTSTDTIRGLILEHGRWNDSAGEVLWTYQYFTFGTASIYGTSGSIEGNNLGSQVISFDPTGKYGWILMVGDLGNEPGHYSSNPIYMQSSDYGQTWTNPQSLGLENLPGMFALPSSANLPNGGHTVVGDAQIVVDSAGNPHIMAVVGLTDTTNNEYVFYPFGQKVLYDIYYNPSVAGCNWQANYLSSVYGYSSYYTSDQVGDGNRVQISRSKDGKKIFVFWTDTDSSVVAQLDNSANINNSNPYPNLFGIGIDIGIGKVTDVVDFTAGNALFGGEVPEQNLVTGTIGGALFPVVSPNALDQGSGNFNIPVVLTDPDYLNSVAASKLSTNPASFYYCQNINFIASEYVNRFDNAPPTLTLNGPDTVWVLINTPYNPPTATAYDCVYGNITPQYSSTVKTNGSGATDSIGIYLSTWTATNGAGNTATANQVVIVAAAPIARIWDEPISGEYKFDFRDSTLNFDTARLWTWGDGTTPGHTVTYTKTYQTGGTKMVTLTAYNRFGQSSDTVYIDVHLTGVNNLELANEINVYPNPTSGMVTVELTDNIATGATVSVYNMLGAQVYQPVDIKSNTTNTTLDLKSLDAGIYMMKVETTSGTAIKQITISK